MDNCTVKYALNLLNGKWKLPIIWQLSQAESIRFNELQRKVEGISALMLSQCLKELEADQIIIRKQYNKIPPKVEYQLSDLGRNIGPALDSLGRWGELASQALRQTKVSDSL